MQEPMTKEYPKRIYLQVKCEDGEDNPEVTWCEDRINDTDIEYIRLGKAMRLSKKGSHE